MKHKENKEEDQPEEHAPVHVSSIGFSFGVVKWGDEDTNDWHEEPGQKPSQLPCGVKVALVVTVNTW